MRIGRIILILVGVILAAGLVTGAVVFSTSHKTASVTTQVPNGQTTSGVPTSAPAATSATSSTPGTNGTPTATAATGGGSDIAITAPTRAVGTPFTLRGTGDIPSGQVLVSFVLAPGTGTYFTDGPAKVNSPGNWWVPQVHLGDQSDKCSNGHTYTVLMVLMPAASSAANTAFHQGDYNASYSARDFKNIFGSFQTWKIPVTRSGSAPAGC
jgi:hypothetical protein